MNEILEKYKKNKLYLSSVIISRYKDIDIGKILATQIWKVLNNNKSSIIKRTLVLLFCKKYELRIEKKSNDQGKYLLIANDGPIRGDNQTIISNGRTFLEPCSVIFLNKKNIIEIHKFPYKISKMLRYMRCIEKVKPFYIRAFYAANLTIIDELSEDIDSELTNVKLLLTFMDTDLFENYIIQIVQAKRGKVAALQHGQRFYINEPCDSYTGMENFTADYKLVWSQFSQEQYMKAGFDVERLPIVGSTRYLDLIPETKVKHKKVIGVFLDGPMTYGSREANRKLLEYAIDVANKYNYTCLVKPHPVDKLENYGNISQNKNVIVVPQNNTIEEISKSIDFAIVHTSGVVIDLLIVGIPVFIFKTSVIFPIELPQNYFFENKFELHGIIGKWSTEDANRDNEFWNIRKKYYVNNPRKLHENFFKKILKE